MHILFYYGPGPTIGEPETMIHSYIPCESPCCGISLTVCRLGDGQVHITNNGQIYFGTENCEDVYEDINFQHVDPFTFEPITTGYSIACEPRCDETVGLTGGPYVTLGKQTNEGYESKPRNIERKLTISATSFYSNSTLSINFMTNLETKSNIEIYNISGKLVKSVEVSPSRVKPLIEIDCAELKTGSYYFNVNVSGVTIHKNKFIVVE